MDLEQDLPNSSPDNAPQDSLSGMPNVIIPQPFSLSRHSDEDKRKIVEEINEKETDWERAMTTFFSEWTEIANSVRMIPRKTTAAKPRGLFNSVSGESRRAVITLANLWFRMLTSSDPFIDLYATGDTANIDPQQNEENLYLARETLMRQQEKLLFKPKLLKTLTSLAAFGTVIVEEPFVQLPLGEPNKVFEGTDFQHRSLLLTGFNPYVHDLDFSDYIFTVDFFNKYKLRDISNQNNDVWDRESIEKAISEEGEGNAMRSDAYARMVTRRQRAGYQDPTSKLFELLNYHGRLDTNNPIFEDYWTSNGRQDDIRFTDWTVGILNCTELVRFHSTAYGTWKRIFRTATVNSFELEPLGYGVGKVGKRYQRELDQTQSRFNDALMMAIYTMWKVGRYAGLNTSQLQIKPFNVVQLDDISQLEPLKTDLQAITQALQIHGFIKEDFRALTQATTNLQAATNDGVTATEASLSQTEAIRGNSVLAEIIAETLMREHFETCHLNNINLLDNPIYVNRFGTQQQVGMNKDNLVRDAGVRIKVSTDKDFRPERLNSIMNLLNVTTSIRNIVPETVNTVKPLLTEAFRLIGVDPRLLNQPKPMAELLSEQLQRMGKANALPQETAGEMAAGGSGGGINSPVGPIPTSPLSPNDMGGRV